MLSIKPDPIRRLAALIKTNAIGIKKITQRWRLSNRDTLRLVSMVSPVLIISPDMDTIDLKRAMHINGSEMIRDIILLAWAEELFNHPNTYQKKIKELVLLQ